MAIGGCVKTSGDKQPEFVNERQKQNRRTRERQYAYCNSDVDPPL